MSREEFWKKQEDIDKMTHEQLKDWCTRLTRLSFQWSDKYFALQRKFEEMEVEISKLK